jgi:membrane protease YdiL (CAAX protease family)
MSDLTTTAAESPTGDLVSVHGWGRRFLSVAQGLAFVAGAVLVGGLIDIGLMAALHLKPDGAAPTLPVMLGLEASQWVGVVVATLLAARAFKMGLAEAGYGGTGAVRGLLLGGALGFVLLSGIIGVLDATGFIHFAPVSFDGATGVMWLAGFSALFLLVALVEEGLIRGPLLALIARAGGFWPAAIATSLLFLALHLGNKGETVIGIANVGLVGLALAWIRYRTGNLWLAIGYHATWDFAQSYVFGVPDSGLMIKGSLTVATLGTGPEWLTGGTAGPEGGLLCSLAVVLLVVLVDRLWPRRTA